VLVAALIGTLVVAIVDWGAKLRPRPAVENVAKPLTTALVVWVAIAADGPRTATVLAVIGLVFCLIGDVALLESVDRFLVGLAAFLVGHLLFIAMFVALHLRHPLWILPVLVLLVVHVATIGRRIVAGAGQDDAEMRGPVIGYLVVISAMAVVAVATGRAWAIAGAAAFVVSDTILGWESFVARRRWMPIAIMVTYHAALVGLALSLR
jgi:uncharacterized membrane protein YhhN